MKRRSAFTLIEILLATALVSIVIGLAMMVLNLSGRSKNVAGAADAMQAALNFQEQFEADLRALAPVKAEPLRWQAPQSGQPRKSRLSFYVYDLAKDPATVTDPQIGALPVTYSFELEPNQKTGFPKRQVENRPPASVGATPFTSLAFDPFHGPTGHLVRVTCWVARDVNDADNPVVHTFLARVPLSPAGGRIPIKPVVEFPQSDDIPGPPDVPTK